LRDREPSLGFCIQYFADSVGQTAFCCISYLGGFSHPFHELFALIVSEHVERCEDELAEFGNLPIKVLAFDQLFPKRSNCFIKEGSVI